MTHTLAEGKVTSKIENGIATVSFYHPQSNSLPGVLLKQIAVEINAVGRDVDARVIVLRSEGDKTFCAGASFDELSSITSEEQGFSFFSGFAKIINAIRVVPKFVIARVQGKAVGGGVGLACAADYTLAIGSASVKLSELAVGIGPFVVGPAVERKIGKSAFGQLTINATEWKDANWAKSVGMYCDVFETIEQLDAETDRLARQLADSNPEAMMLLKRVFWQGAEDWDILLEERAKMSGKLVLSDFTSKAITKFKKK